MFGGRREETKAEAEAPFVQSSKKPLSSLVNPLYIQSPTSPSNPASTRFKRTKMSGSIEGQPGDVRSPSFDFHLFSDPIPYCRESPHLRSQLGHNLSNRAPHTFPPLLNLLIHSAASQTFLAISPRSPPRLSFSPLFPSQSFPVRHNLFETSCSLDHAGCP